MTGAPIDPTIKGWCPGALRPMDSGDGLVVRLRLPLGRMTPDEARGIAGAARRHGNGQIELSGRGNLQLRGVGAASHPALLTDLAALGVLDGDLETEARRNILISPFRVSGDGAEALALDLTRRLMELPALPAKFGFVIDTGPERHLAEVPGDLRVERGAKGGLILRADGAPLGQGVAAADAVSALIGLARWFVASGGVRAGRGRMRALTGSGLIPPGADQPPAALAAPSLPGPGPGGVLAAFEFGSFPAERLEELAALGRPMVLTPWRMILIEGLADPSALAAIPGLILSPESPLMRVRACPGAPFCPQALGPTRALARALAPLVPLGRLVHVSGCAKGCAHPRTADATLVASPGGYALGRGQSAAEVRGAAMTAEALLQNPDIFDPERGQ
ncbi:MAG: precorrin-3B synthase [Paracoccaceae bacterium]